MLCMVLTEVLRVLRLGPSLYMKSNVWNSLIWVLTVSIILTVLQATRLQLRTAELLAELEQQARMLNTRGVRE